MFKPAVRACGVSVAAVALVALIGDWTLIAEVTDGIGAVTKIEPVDQYLNSLRANRDLGLSIAAGAFAFWSHLQNKAASVTQAHCDAFHHSYGEKIMASIHGIREIGVDIEVACRKTAMSHNDLAAYIRDDAEQRFVVHIVALHSCYRELREANPTHQQAVDAHSVAIECEDSVLAQLSTLTGALDGGNVADIVAQRSRTTEVFTSVCQQLSGKYDALRRSPPEN